MRISGRFRVFLALFAAAMVVTLAAGQLRAAVFADYYDDYSGTSFPTGWQYLWNAPSDWDPVTTSAQDGSTGPLGSIVDYEPLIWSGSRWSADGNNTTNDSSPSAYLYFTSGTSHPGRGSTQSETSGGTEPLTVANSHDRCPIAAYTIQPGDLAGGSGPVLITNSALTKYSAYGTTGMKTLVHGDDGQIVFSQSVANGSTASFDKYIGNFSTGDTIYVAFSPDTHDGSDGFRQDFSLFGGQLGSKGEVVVADYRDDYQTGAPAEGWQYLWNPGGPIGDPANYVPMVWDNGRYETVVNGAFPDPMPGYYTYLHPTGGHTGRGTASGYPHDHGPITAYTVPIDSGYSIIDSLLSVGSTNSNGIEVSVHVNDGPVLFSTVIGAGSGSGDFNTYLNSLRAGDVIYVALGPNASDGSDSFYVDFSIAMVPEPGSIVLFCAGLLGFCLLSPRRRKR